MTSHPLRRESSTSAPYKLFAMLLLSSWTVVAIGQTYGRRESIATPAFGRSVALVAGSCVAVFAGDAVTLDWSPEFDHSETVQGVRELSLLFARANEDNSARRGHGGLRLQTKLSHGGQGASASGARSHNEVRSFLPNLAEVPPGNYYLVEAVAVPLVELDNGGSTPVVTNDPTRAGYCLSVSKQSGVSY